MLYLCVGFGLIVGLLDGTAGADIKEMQNKQCMSLDLSLWSVYRLLTRCEITPRPRCV